jgi:hypothetical protein
LIRIDSLFVRANAGAAFRRRGLVGVPRVIGGED